jgi:hypothetical protein
VLRLKVFLFVVIFDDGHTFSLTVNVKKPQRLVSDEVQFVYPDPCEIEVILWGGLFARLVGARSESALGGLCSEA